MTTVDEVAYGAIITGFTSGTPTNVAASFTPGSGNLVSMIAFHHKMLVPPGFTITVTNQGRFSIIACAEADGMTSLENALAIM